MKITLKLLNVKIRVIQKFIKLNILILINNKLVNNS